MFFLAAGIEASLKELNPSSQSCKFMEHGYAHMDNVTGIFELFATYTAVLSSAFPILFQIISLLLFIKAWKKSELYITEWMHKNICINIQKQSSAKSKETSLKATYSNHFRDYYFLEKSINAKIIRVPDPAAFLM